VLLYALKTKEGKTLTEENKIYLKGVEALARHI